MKSNITKNFPIYTYSIHTLYFYNAVIIVSYKYVAC